MANRAQGKGYEDDRFYKSSRCIFFPIENIHVVRESLEKFQEAIENPSTSTSCGFYDFQKAVKDSGWTQHLQSIISCALQVSDWIRQGSAMILHCSDGWDRTSQVCGLVQILLDPYFRTV